MASGILALDLATQLGFARWHPGQEVQYDTVSLRTSSRHPGAKSCVLGDWFGGMIEADEPELVIYESPIPAMPAKEGKGFSNTSTLKHQLAMATVIEIITCRWDVEVVHAATSTARAWFCDNGRAQKPDVMAQCVARGWDPPDHNAGDALCLLDYAVHLFRFTDYEAQYPHIVEARRKGKRR